MQKSYPGPMIRTGPDLAGFSRWVRRVLKDMKTERGWGITRVAQEAKTPRSLVSRWRDADWTQGRPTRETVERFCENLGVSKDEPFARMRWALEPRDDSRCGDRPVEPPPESGPDRQIRLIKTRLGQNPPSGERRRLERLLLRANRYREDLRLMDEELREILGEDAPDHHSAD